jgi:catechol 2,3-dioxygenase-like lactoylglutathione lyase family enzyme
VSSTSGFLLLWVSFQLWTFNGLTDTQVPALGADLIPRFWIGKGQTVFGRLHIAFAAPSHEIVAAFHAAGLAAGGSDHGGPGFRANYADNYYAAYIRDPDGHVVEAVCRRADA